MVLASLGWRVELLHRWLSVAWLWRLRQLKGCGCHGCGLVSSVALRQGSSAGLCGRDFGTGCTGGGSVFSKGVSASGVLVLKSFLCLWDAFAIASAILSIYVASFL